jgi:hypothetical protein
MRALCGAIITAGALIGLGLAALGIGTRYAPVVNIPSEGKDPTPYLVHISQMDRPLVFIVVFLVCVALIGLGIAFVGLAYHHHRRHREFLWEKERAAAQQRTTV